MKASLSVVMITKNAQDLIERSLNSVKDIADEIIIVDDYSKDKTIEIVHKVIKVHKVLKVYQHHEQDLGKQKKYAVDKATKEWILLLDSDEIISDKLRPEIKFKVQNAKFKIRYDGYYIPYQNHFLGRPVNHGGENYRMIRLFRKGAEKITPNLVHEKVELENNRIGKLTGKINHFSYRSLGQMFRKFTDYAIRDAKQKKLRGEKSSLQKIILNPAHMFWARFIEDKGYKDGWFRIPLDLGFAYMEFLTYLLMI